MKIREAVISYKRSAASVAFQTPEGKVTNRINSSRDVVALVRSIFDAEEFTESAQERMVVVGLDAKNRPIAWNLVALGSATACYIDAGAIYRFAILAGCVGIVVAHNHPSGDPTPSAEDLLITEKLRLGGELLGVRLVDHVVLGGSESFSFVDSGLLYRGGGV